MKRGGQPRTRRRKGDAGKQEGERASGREPVEDKSRRHMDPERDLTGKLLVGVLAGGGNPRIMPVGGCMVKLKQKAK